MTLWLDEIRIVRGNAVWTSTFTPPASPYTVGDVATVQAAGLEFTGTLTAIETGDTAAISGQVTVLPITGTLTATEARDVSVIRGSVGILYKLSADGCVPVLVDDAAYCCPPPLCGNDLCCTFVAFMNQLPTGPLWTYWKEAAISYFQHSDDPSECPLVKDPACPSLVLHAIYCVLKLKALVHDALWPAFRESDPNTAVTTLDYHLERLQWEDCYHQHCRDVLLGDITPVEVWSECGPIFCQVDYPPELICAMKRNIAIALTRINMGVIKNLCSLNWIIEPLGAQITPVYEPQPVVDEECDPDVCSNIAFEVCNKQDWMYGCPSGDLCDTLVPLPKIQAYWDTGCDRPAGLPERIWPGVMAAHCIVRSMIPPACPSNIKLCC